VDRVRPLEAAFEGQAGLLHIPYALSVVALQLCTPSCSTWRQKKFSNHQDALQAANAMTFPAVHLCLPLQCCFFAHTPEQLRQPAPQDSSLPALPQKADRQAAHSRNSSNSSNTVDTSGARRTGSGTILSSGNGSSLPPIKCAVQRSASAGAAIIGAVSGATPAPLPMAQHGSGLPMRPNSLSISKHAASASSSSSNLLLHAAAPELLRAMSCTPAAPAAPAAVQGCGDMLVPQAVPLAFNASASAPAPAGAFNAGLHGLAWQSPASTAMATTTAAAAPGSKMVRVPLDIALEAAMLAQSAGDSSLPPLPAPLQHAMVGSSALQGCSVWPELTSITAMQAAASTAMTSPAFGLDLSATAAAAQQLLAAQHQELLASMLVQQSLAASEQQQQQRQEQDRLQEMWFAAFNAAKGVGLGDPEAAACADCAVKQTATAAPAVPSAVCPVSSAAPGCPAAAAAASMLGGGLPMNAQLLHQQQGQQQLQALQLTAALQEQQQHQEQQLLASLMLGNGMQQQGQPLVEVPHCKQVEAFDVLGHLGGLTSTFAGLLQ